MSATVMGGMVPLEVAAHGMGGRLRRNSLQNELSREFRHVPDEDFRILSGMSGLWERPQGVTERAGSVLALGTTGRFGSALFFPGFTDDRTVIENSLRRVLMFSRLDPDRLQRLADSLVEKELTEGAVLLQGGSTEGGEGVMYMVKSGKLSVLEQRNGQQIVIEKTQRGDLLNVSRLLFDRPSPVTVVALTRVVVWVLERETVQEVLTEAELARVTLRELFLHSVPLLDNLSNADFLLVAESCKEVEVAHGERVVHQGEFADKFFIIMEGEAIVCQAGALSSRASARVSETKVNHLIPGDFFGEWALLHAVQRSASVMAMHPCGLRCVVVQRDVFMQCLAPLHEVMRKAKSPGMVLRRLGLSAQGLWLPATVQLRRSPEAQQAGLPAERVCKGLVSADALHGVTEDVNGGIYLCVQEGALLGRGGTSVVRAAADAVTGRLYALKSLLKAAVVQTREHIFCEQAITRGVVHPFCLRQFASFSDHSHLYFLLDLVDGCDLMDLLAGSATVFEPAVSEAEAAATGGRPRPHTLRGLQETHAAYYVGCVALAFDFLHRQCGVVYRDLKPENVLIGRDGAPKLGDFGFAKELPETGRTFTFCGTPGYVAPEVVQGKGYTCKVDWWGLGVLLYVLVTGSQPFSLPGAGNDPVAVFRRVADPGYEVTFPPYPSPEMRDLTGRLLERNPELRAEGPDLFGHAFFAGVEWDSLLEGRVPPPPLVQNGLKAQAKRLRGQVQEVRKSEAAHAALAAQLQQGGALGGPGPAVDPNEVFRDF